MEKENTINYWSTQEDMKIGFVFLIVVLLNQNELL